MKLWSSTLSYTVSTHREFHSPTDLDGSSVRRLGVNSFQMVSSRRSVETSTSISTSALFAVPSKNVCTRTWALRRKVKRKDTRKYHIRLGKARNGPSQHISRRRVWTSSLRVRREIWPLSSGSLEKEQI